jgi:hypothetical protein
MGKRRRLQDGYRFAGLRPLATARGVFGDPKARIVVLVRRRKKQRAASVGVGIAGSTIADAAWCGTCRLPTCASTWTWKYAALHAGAAGP